MNDNTHITPFLDKHPRYLPGRILCGICYCELCQRRHPGCYCGECLRREYSGRIAEPKSLTNWVGRLEGDGNHFYPNRHGRFHNEQSCGMPLSSALVRPVLLEKKSLKHEMSQQNSILCSGCGPASNDNCKNLNKQVVDVADSATLSKAHTVDKEVHYSNEMHPSKKRRSHSDGDHDIISDDKLVNGSILPDLEKNIKTETPDKENNVSPPKLDGEISGNLSSVEVSQSSQDTPSNANIHSETIDSTQASTKKSRGRKLYSNNQKRYNTRTTRPRTYKSDYIVPDKNDWKKDDSLREDATKGRQRSKLNRLLANEHERRRVSQLNNAYQDLRKMIPGYQCDTKLPKIKILRYAIKYIAHLDEILQEPEDKE